MIVPPDILKELAALSILNVGRSATLHPNLATVTLPLVIVNDQADPPRLSRSARIKSPPSTIMLEAAFGAKKSPIPSPAFSVPALTRISPFIVHPMADADIVPPLHHKPAVLGTRYGEPVILDVKGVMVEALESLNVPFVSVKPPEDIVIKDCTSITFVFAVPLFTVIPPLNAVVEVPVTVLEKAPVKVTLAVPPLYTPLF